MKKTVFLFLLVLTFLNVPSKAQAAEMVKTYEFSEFTIVIEQVNEASNKGFSIEKNGINSFYARVLDDGIEYYVNGVAEYLDKYVVYGYVHEEEAQTFYDSFIIVFDNQGSLLYKEIADYDSLEETKEVFVIDNILIVSTDQHIHDNTYVKIKNIFTSYGPDLEKINEVEIVNNKSTLSINSSLILLNLDYDSIYEYGLNSDLDIIENDDLLGVEHESIYSSGVYLEFINEIEINGNIYSEPFFLEYPGNYTIEKDGSIRSFTIEANVSGIIDNQISSEEVIVNFSAGNAMLNNEIYLSGERISRPGNYTLVIRGANDYALSYDFVITSNFSGIINNNTYDEEVTLLFNGNGYINNQFINSGDSIDEEGEYILKINGENNYLETYYFEIEYPEENMSIAEAIQKYDIFVLALVLVGGAVILKKR